MTQHLQLPFPLNDVNLQTNSSGIPGAPCSRNLVLCDVSLQLKVKQCS